ncbi:MAG: hypothetical protein LBQ60_18985 [Bacteroidales bacterium]|nr:hypothetical protein [Bacteroidales bacterium]
MNNFIIACLFSALCIIGCTGVRSGKAENKGRMAADTIRNRIPVFNSGFEDAVHIVSRNEGNNEEKFTGIDHSVAPPNNWDQFQAPLRSINLQYQGGDSTMRFARIVPDPTNPANKVLTMRIISPNAGDRSRVQTNASAPEMPEMFQSVRVYLHPDMAALKQYPDVIDWLLLAEWWNDSPKGWNTPDVYRVSLRLRKEKGPGNDLFFKVDAQTVTYTSVQPEKGSGAQFHTEWEYVNKDFPVPFGKWMTFEYYIKAGNQQTGRFSMAVTPDGEERSVIFDVQGATQSLLKPSPTGFNMWNPMKFYTSIPVTNYMKGIGKAYQVYFDDLKIWEVRR